MIESPPSSKKLSSAPTSSRFSAWAHMPARTSSTGVAGARYPPARPGRAVPGAGSAARSSFPAGVSGSAASSVNTAGIMYSGRLAARCDRSSPAGGMPAPAAAGTSHAASRTPVPSPTAPAAAAATPG